MGIGVRMSAKVVTIKGNLTQNLNRAIRRIYLNAIKAFARAVFVRVRVDIGQARSSVLPAGRAVRAALGGVSGRSPRKYEKKARPDYPFGRTKTAGIRQGQATLNIVDGVTYEFSWTTSVQHFAFREANGTLAIEAGRRAFRAELRAGFKTLNKVIRSSFQTKTLGS